MRTQLRKVLTFAGRLTFLSAACASITDCGPGTPRCAEGETRCASATQTEYCIEVWLDGESKPHTEWRPEECDSGKACVEVPDVGAICVAGGQMDPLCDQTIAHCDGDALVQCAGGYATSRKPCGTDTPGGIASTHCIASTSLGATCIPPSSAIESICAAASEPQCDGTALIECVEGFAVFRMNCRACSVVPNDTPCSSCAAHRGVCTGYLGDDCSADADCADGLVCHVEPGGGARCSTACTVTPAESGGTCAQSAGSNGLPLSSYAEIHPGGVSPYNRYSTLNCIAGFCTWVPYGAH